MRGPPGALIERGQALGSGLTPKRIPHEERGSVTQPNFTPMEAEKVQAFLNGKLNPELQVRLRQRPDECAEIYLGAECLGVVSKNVDEGETSYSFEITILDIDLEGV